MTNHFLTCMGPPFRSEGFHNPTLTLFHPWQTRRANGIAKPIHCVADGLLMLRYVCYDASAAQSRIACGTRHRLLPRRAKDMVAVPRHFPVQGVGSAERDGAF
jgi:hypothetical protein